MTLKQNVYYHFLGLMNQKLNHLQSILADLKESGANETKSTAGDKHETALAMLQIEQANTRGQLQETMSQKNTLDTIDPSVVAAFICKGSLVKTNKGYFFISVALGKAKVDRADVIAISPQSPLGIKLLGLKVGEHTTINNHHYQIESIE